MVTNSKCAREFWNRPRGPRTPSENQASLWPLPLGGRWFETPRRSVSIRVAIFMVHLGGRPHFNQRIAVRVRYWPYSITAQRRAACISRADPLSICQPINEALSCSFFGRSSRLCAHLNPVIIFRDLDAARPDYRSSTQRLAAAACTPRSVSAPLAYWAADADL